MNAQRQEAAFQQLYDTANKILEATYNDEETARKAIEALSATRIRLERRVDELSVDITKKVDSSVSKTANEAARLLTEKFKAADAAAEQARGRYESAGQRLTWKLLGWATALQCVLLVGAWLIVQRTLPSQNEIDGRRQVIEQLSQQASSLHMQIGSLQRDINGMATKVTNLERRGGRLELANCGEEGQPRRLCFRTNESESDAPVTIGDKTFRIPWGY
ncbi:hypothetical protein [Burkholderia stagnalis]|uniref:hypothetical protein n=1 Tax=Burkholderia stagnalis TaxID=1503054 RepID=UPI000A6821C3|nr:hypothetical protein [Burkholderia stagnalis]